MSRKFQKFSSKNIYWNWMRRILQADQRPKQNHKDEILPSSSTKTIRIVELNQVIVHSPILMYRRNWFIFFVMEVYLEKMMEQLNSGELKTIFRNISRDVIIGLTKSGRTAWQEEEETWKTTGLYWFFSTMLYLLALPGHSGRSLIDPTLQDNVAIPSNFFQYICHVGCAIKIHSIINSGLIPGGQNLSNRQTVFFLPVDPMDKSEGSWYDRFEWTVSCTYVQNAWKRRQNAVYLVDIRLDRTRSFFTKHFQLILFRKLLECKLEESSTRKYTCHLGLLHRSPWKMIGRENWVKNMLNDQTDKFCNNPKVSNRTNQFQTQIMTEQGNPLFALRRGASRSQENDTRSFTKKLSKKR